MESRITFLIILILILWLVLNPKSRDFIKSATQNLFSTSGSGQ